MKILVEESYYAPQVKVVAVKPRAFMENSVPPTPTKDDGLDDYDIEDI